MYVGVEYMLLIHARGHVIPYARTRAQAHAHASAHAHAHAHARTHAHTHAHTPTQTQTDRQTDRQTHTHIHTSHANIDACANASHSCIYPRENARAYAYITCVTYMHAEMHSVD